jgi:photosystem II stability/assembly factor-like uncharacterized protein
MDDRDDRDLKERLREEFDSEGPSRDAYRQALDSAFDQQPGRLPGWTVPVAAVVAVAIVTSLALGQHVSGARSLHPVAARSGQATAQTVYKAVPGVLSPAYETPAVHVAARSPREALASAGDVIERTEDGGQSWAVLFAGMEGHRGTVRDLEWVTASVAFAATTYGLIRLDTRPPRHSLVNQRQDIQRLDFVSPLEGYAIAGDRVIKTADGGRSFSDLEVGLTLVSWIQWVSVSRAWAAGPRGVVATADGGRTWSAQLDFEDPPETSSSVPWTQVGFTDALNGFAYHHAGDANTVMHTANGGRTWEPAARLPTGSTSDLVVTGPASAEVIEPTGSGKSSLCATADAGMTWRCSKLPLPGAPGQMVARGAVRWLALVDSGAVFAVSKDLKSWTTERRALAA